MLKAEDIALALLDRAALLAVGSPALPIAMPDIAPPWGEDDAPDKYLAVTIFDNVPRWTPLGKGKKIAQGILQVEVVWPRGLGTIQNRGAAQEVMEHFPKDLILRSGSARVSISGEPWHGSAVPSAAGTSIAVSIPWNASSL